MVIPDIESQQSVLSSAGNVGELPSNVWRLYTFLLLVGGGRVWDLESQKITVFDPLARNSKWRYSFLIFLARTILISRSDNADHTTLIERPHAKQADLELTGTMNILLEVPIDIHCDDNGDHNCSIKCQQANITRILKEDLVSLHKCRGVQGIAEILNTDLNNGIPENEEDLYSRKLMATTQSITQAPTTGFFGTLLISRSSCIIFLLLLSAGMSLAFGIMEEGTRTGWYEGVIIIIAIIILVLVHSIHDYWHKHLQKLSKKEETVVDVIRGGSQQQISISDVVLGDIVCLERNHQVPADGLFISGEFFELDAGLESIDDQNPFMFFGSEVINGHAHMLVTCVDMNRVIQSPKKTQLQDQLDKVSTNTQIIGLIISILILVVEFLRFEFGKDDGKSDFSEIKGKSAASKELMEAIMRIVTKPTGKINLLTTSLTMFLVGIVEGLPVVVSLAVARINKRALFLKAHVQDTSGCLTMGTITTICTNITGGLTLNLVEVDMCWIGEDIIEDCVIASEVVEAFCDGIYALQSTQSSTTDNQLISWWASKFGLKKMEILKKICTMDKVKEVNSNDERSGMLLERKKGDNETNMRLHWKGHATAILPMCSHYYDITGLIHAMDESKKTDIEKLIERMQSKNLEIVAFAHKQTDVCRLEEDNLILIGLLGLKQTSWEESKAMADYRDAGVSIKLVSTEDVSVLQAIAEKCRMFIPNSDQMVLKGEDFRKLTHEKRMEIVDRIAVLGNSLSSDRLLFVQYLKQKGNRVAVVGVRTIEIPTMKEADVGIAMGIRCTKISKETSDIFIHDGNLSFLVSIIRHGWCGYNNIQKYIQLVLTTMIAGLLINTITTAFWGNAAITAIQFAWTNLIVLVFGGLALLTESPTDEQLPLSRNHEQLITKVMWKSIFIQSSYQVAILITFLHNGQAILGINQEVSQAMIFNAFLLCQVFNIFNARKLDEENVFKSVHKNPWFWVAVGVTVLLQAAFIEIASILSGIARLNCEQWAVCSLIGMVSWVIHLFSNRKIKDRSLILI